MSRRTARTLIVLGLLAMILGAIDPLEGSIVIALGSAVVTVGAYAQDARYRKMLLVSSILVALGVAALWAFSAMGGFGGNSGRPLWYGLALLPYPVGWIMGLAGAVCTLRQPRIV